MNLTPHLRAPTESSRRKHRPACLAALGGALFFSALAGAMAAEGPISATQDALKRESLYTGETTGVLDGPTRTALRRYQILHALPVTGEIDGDTLQTLEKAVPPAAAATTVEAQPARVAEAPAPEVVEGDKQFLKEVESTEAPPPAVPEDVAPVVEPPADVPVEASAAAAPEPVSKPPTVKAKPAPVKKHSVEKPRETVRIERAIPADPDAAPVLEPFLETQRRPVARFAPSPVALGERESDADITASSGVKVTRAANPATARDGRTHVQEKGPASVEDAPVPEVVHPPRAKRPNFFSRLFHGSPE